MAYSSPLLAHPGAAENQDPVALDAAGVAWHYGNPLGEQRAVEGGSAIIDRSQRRVIRVAGPDAGVFLNNLLSQKLDAAAPGFTAGALNLDAQGHVLHAADVAVTADAIYLDVPAASADSLLDYLQKMIFWSQVTVEEAPLAIVTVLGAPLPELADAAFTRTVTWPQDSELGAPRRDVAVPRERLEQAVAELESRGGTLAGLMAFTAERVRAREPELAADLDAKTIPHEVPQWIGRGQRPGAVHLEKGCYRGQETVARVENLGRSPRMLVMLHLDGSAPQLPSPGAEITAGGRRVGRLGTVVHDCDYGPIALALVKRSALAGAAELAIGDVTASVEPASLPAEEGPKAGRVAVERLRSGGHSPDVDK